MTVPGFSFMEATEGSVAKLLESICQKISSDEHKVTIKYGSDELA